MSARPQRTADTPDRAPKGKALRVEALELAYGPVTALHGVSVEVPAGSVVAVLGSNGAGKTSLMRAVSGTHRLHRGRVVSGRIWLGDTELTSLSPPRVVGHGVVQVPEGRRVFGRLSVAENLEAGAIGVREPSEEQLDRIHELFPVLARRRNQRAGLLSGGEQQMLAIGRALMSRPSVLLLDEPSLGLAPRIIEQVFESVRAINAAGTSVLLVEQNARMALQIADTAVVLESGLVSLSGTSAELLDSPELSAVYLGGTASAPASTSVATPVPARGTDNPGHPASKQSTRGAAGLRVEDVTLRFGGVTALDAVSVDVTPGTIHALIGPNGAGKSSCFNVVSGVYRPSSGHVHLDDVEIGRLPAHQLAGLGVGRAFQHPTLSPNESVADNLRLGLHSVPSPRAERSRPWRRATHEDWLAEVADLFGLTAHLTAPAGSLSYGQQKRVDIARAVLTRPRLLLLDEPAAGLDPGESEQIGQLVMRTRDALDTTVLLVEHDMSLVMAIADRITVLNFGVRIAEGTADEVRSDPAVIEAYLGTDAMEEQS